MSTLSTLWDKVSGGIAGASVGAAGINEAVDNYESTIQSARESLLELELSIEDAEWKELRSQGQTEFNRSTIKKLIALSRVMYLANPLIKRAVTVQELYVWGSGVDVNSPNETVEEVMEDFFEDPRNQRVIGETWPEREKSRG